MSPTFKVSGLFAGKPQPMGPRGAPSSIVKSATNALTVHFDGTDEDEQANKILHGGPEKVLHQFCPTSYLTLAKHFPGGNFEIGSIGENVWRQRRFSKHSGCELCLPRTRGSWRGIGLPSGRAHL